MKQVSILYNNNTILNRVWQADSFITRLKGLMFRKSLEEKEGMLITPCRQIHTFFMKFPIDVLFINREGIIQEAIADMPAGKVSSFVKTGISVLEMKAGIIKKYNINEGSYLEIRKEGL